MEKKLWALLLRKKNYIILIMLIKYVLNNKIIILQRINKEEGFLMHSKLHLQKLFVFNFRIKINFIFK